MITIESCKACAMKHLSDALMWLNDEDAEEVVRNAYISGNLSHASGHLLESFPNVADQVRNVRLAILDPNLRMIVDKDTAIEYVQNLIKMLREEADKREEAEKNANKAAETAETAVTEVSAVAQIVEAPKKSGGCGCGKRH